MNKKQVIRINESQLKQIVIESVKRVLNETYNGFEKNGNSLKMYKSDFDSFIDDNDKIEKDRKENLINAQEKQYLQHKLGKRQKFTDSELKALKTPQEPLRDYTLPDEMVKWLSTMPREKTSYNLPT